MFSLTLFSLSHFRVEKNATNWSKDKIKELLKTVKVENEKGELQVLKVFLKLEQFIPLS